MPLALTHFFVGFGLGTLLMYYLWGRVSYFGAALSGIWAVVPDLYQLFPEGTWYRAAYGAVLHDSRIGDLFWFHHLLDGVDVNDTVTAVFLSLWFAVGAVLFVDVHAWETE